MKTQIKLTAVRSLLAASLIASLIVQTGCGNPQESARKELAKIGKDFNPAAFLDSIANDDKVAVRLFIAAGMNVNQPLGNGFTPLMFASDKGDSDLVKLLLDGGADANAMVLSQRGTKITALQLANQSQNAQVVSMLRAKGAKDFNQINKDLAVAVINGIPNDVKALLSQGADPNIQFAYIELLDSEKPHIIEMCHDYTPLTQALKHNQEAVAKILLDHGADPNIRGVSHDTGFHGDSPLMLSVENTNEVIVRLLLEKKVDLNVRNDGRTALTIARKGGLSRIEQLLTDAGEQE